MYLFKLNFLLLLIQEWVGQVEISALSLMYK